MGSQELQRKLGFWAVLAIAVGTTVGSGIFVSVGEVAKAAGMWGSDQFWAEFVQPGRTCKPCVARGVVI